MAPSTDILYVTAHAVVIAATLTVVIRECTDYFGSYSYVGEYIREVLVTMDMGAYIEGAYFHGVPIIILCTVWLY